MLIISGKNKELQNIVINKNIKYPENVVTIDMSKLNFGSIREQCEAQTLFGPENKTIILKNWSFIKNSKEIIKPQEIKEFFHSIKDDVQVIIINDGKISKLAENALSEFQKINEFKFGSFEKQVMVKKLISNSKTTIEPEALKLIIEYSSDSPSQLVNEVKKLILLDDVITTRMVMDNINNYNEENLFVHKIAYNLISGKNTDAYEYYKKVVSQGWNDIVIMSLVTKTLIREKSKILEKSPNIINANFSIYNKFGKIENIINKLLYLELSVKKSEINSSLGMEMLFIQAEKE